MLWWTRRMTLSFWRRSWRKVDVLQAPRHLAQRGVPSGMAMDLFPTPWMRLILTSSHQDDLLLQSQLIWYCPCLSASLPSPPSRPSCWIVRIGYYCRSSFCWCFQPLWNAHAGRGYTNWEEWASCKSWQQSRAAAPVKYHHDWRGLSDTSMEHQQHLWLLPSKCLLQDVLSERNIQALVHAISSRSAGRSSCDVFAQLLTLRWLCFGHLIIMAAYSCYLGALRSLRHVPAAVFIKLLLSLGSRLAARAHLAIGPWVMRGICFWSAQP